MRLFTGLSIGGSVLQNLGQTMERLRELAPIQWSPVQNLHITLKFIGQWPDGGVGDVEQVLAGIAMDGPIPIEVRGARFLPSARQPRILVANAEGARALRNLASRIDEALEKVGCAREQRPYTPHVTLARIKKSGDAVSLREQIVSMTDFDFGTYAATAFHLYRSEPGKKGSTYTILSSY